VLLKNTNKIPYYLGLTNVIFVNKFNHFIQHDKVSDTSILKNKNCILYHSSDIQMNNILDEDYFKIKEKFDIITNDLILLRKYLSLSVLKRGKSLILIHSNNIFFTSLYKCFKCEYKKKIDFVII
jgi:hypothetical protein